MPPITLALAPLEGITDALVRDMLCSIGGIDYCVTGFVRVSHEPVNASVIERECPEIGRGCRTASGTPVHLQLLGGQPEPLAESAAVAVALGAQVIDLNFGCPVKRVNRHDGGAALLREPDRIRRILVAVRDRLPSTIPVSVKVRLGWDDPSDVTRICLAAQDGGASWITIHARTRQQVYRPSADWTWIARAKQSLSIPIVANGDICDLPSLLRCRQITGCDRFMIGRAAIAFPELFLLIRQQLAQPWHAATRIRLMRKFLHRMTSVPFHVPVVVGRVKGWCGYMAGIDPLMRAVFDRLKWASSVEQADTILAEEEGRIDGLMHGPTRDPLCQPHP